jgi:hypothetical protein
VAGCDGSLRADCITASWPRSGAVLGPQFEWRKRVTEEATELRQGMLSHDDACAAVLWPESLLHGTDSALVLQP